jgi:hypothetical protein
LKLGIYFRNFSYIRITKPKHADYNSIHIMLRINTCSDSVKDNTQQEAHYVYQGPYILKLVVMLPLHFKKTLLLWPTIETDIFTFTSLGSSEYMLKTYHIV